MSEASPSIRDVKLTDRYDAQVGTVLLSGMQALVRLPLLQKQRDLAAGLNTAGFISGYRGSPVGSYDLQLNAAKKWLDSSDITFRPGLNEDLAATAIWGTQQSTSLPGARYDGVFSIWYGKGPGVDRSGDAFRHGNRFGASEHGGVVLVVGDDHPGKSSTVAHQSDQALAANDIPVLYPATVQEYIDFGLHGFGLSRFSALWVGLKCVNETADCTATVALPEGFSIELPELDESTSENLRGAMSVDALGDEIRVQQHRLVAAKAYARANDLDRVTLGGGKSKVGIVTTGKSWCDVVSALKLLGIDSSRAAKLGLSVYKVGLVWPLEETGLESFAANCEELLFVEEKRAFIEHQAAHILFNNRSGRRPALVGKQDEDGNALFSSAEQLAIEQIAIVIGGRLQRRGTVDDELRESIDRLESDRNLAKPLGAGLPIRTPYFCSGCPHNTSTKVPDGSVAMSGIGCHTMALFMNRDTLPPTQMGGEGANWIGIAPHTSMHHVFQNLGDGTYNHSGLMAIRASVAAGVNITYKILYNDAVAMTGGQPVEGVLTVPDIVAQLKAESVERVAVIYADEPDDRVRRLRGKGVTIDDRSELDRLQRELREVEGVSAIIFDQTCAAEKRRRRKRKLYPDPPKRAFINSAVCEGCGDCSAKANCISIVPEETRLGRKRKIDQSSCNKDYSCVTGFCPSFVTVHGGDLRKPDKDTGTVDVSRFDMPEPVSLSIDDTYNVLITGIGGTGVTTISAILAMAAHLEGKAVSAYDMTGLAQKGGAVQSHLRISCDSSIKDAARIGVGQADLLIGCDPLVTSSDDAGRTISSTNTYVLLNNHTTPTGAFQLNPDIDFANAAVLSAVSEATAQNRLFTVEATQIAERILGNSIGANMIMLGYALQKGVLPIGRAAVGRAVELNGVAVAANKAAIEIGRVLAWEPEHIASEHRALVDTEESLHDIVEYRVNWLTDYQNAALGEHYREVIDSTSKQVGKKLQSTDALSKAIARNYFRLLAYKDEYEVARLYSTPEYRQRLRSTFEGNYKLRLHFAAPILSRRDKESGELQKISVGGWVFPILSLLSKLKFLRGTPLDVFGYTRERRDERALIGMYQSVIDSICRNVSVANVELATQVARVPETIRGFGHVKERNRVAGVERMAALLAELEESERNIC